MQVIHLLHDLGLHPRRTVRCIAWMSEEEGSEGAAQYMATTKTISPTTSALSRATSEPTIQPASSTQASRLSDNGCVPWLECWTQSAASV